MSIPNNSAPIQADLIVRKSNELSIAGYELTLDEYRILETAIGIYGVTNSPIIRFKVKDMYSAIDKNRRNIYGEFDKLSDSLMSKFIKIPTTIRGKTKWIKESIVKRCVYDDGDVEITFSNEALYLFSIKPGALNSSHTSYQLADSIDYDSIAASRLFGIAATNAYKGFYEGTLEEFRTGMGIKEGLYKQFGHLKSKVIEPNRIKVNKRGILIIHEPVYQKEGRKIVGLKFEITDNRNALPAIEVFDEPIQRELLSEDDHLVSLLLAGGFTNTSDAVRFLPQLSKFAANVGLTDVEYLQSNLQYVQQVASKKGTTLTGGYLRKALESDYARNTRTEQTINKKANKAAQTPIESKVAQVTKMKTLIEKLNYDYRKSIEAIYTKEYESYSEDDKKNLDFQFIKTLEKNSAELKVFKSRGWQSALLFSQYEVFWREHVGLTLISFEEYALRQGHDLTEIKKVIEDIERDLNG